MTIRMLQAWNGLHQQKIVTTLSGSDEAALVAAGIATYDLDGPAENLRMAQLATDGGASTIYPREFRLENYLLDGEAWPGAGTSDAQPLIQRAVADAAASYISTGLPVQVVVPAGVYRLDAQITWASGVGLVGAGRLDTIFKPNGAFSAIRGPLLAANAYYTGCVFNDFTIDCALQPVETFDYSRKGIYIGRMRDCSWTNVSVGNAHATGFGVDFLERCKFTDCYAYNCGRGNSSDRFSSGAGFGFALGLSAQESIELIGCRSSGNRTHGFYLEFSPSNGATYNPTGIKLTNCVASGNWIGLFDAGAKGCQVSGGEYSTNLLAGILVGQNGASTQAGVLGNITGALIAWNGQADYTYSDYHGNATKYTAGGVVFMESALATEYAIRGCSIINNIGAGVASVCQASLEIDGNTIADNQGAGVSVKTYSAVKRLRIVRNRIARNGTGSLTTVDGVMIDAPTTNLFINSNIIYDDQATKTQTKAIALRGLHTSTGVVIADNDARDAGGSGAIRIEQTCPGIVNTNYTDGTSAIATTITNLFTNPQFETATAGTAVSNCTNSRPSGMTPHTGTYILRGTCTNTSLAQLTLAAMTVAPGDVITFSAYVRCNSGRTVRLAIKDASSSDYWTGLPVVADGNWQRHSFTFVVPVGVTSVRPTFWRDGGSGAANGDLLDVDSTMWTIGRDNFDYFDGATNGGAWTGTANASTSTKSIAV
jgi:hypothetical protein